MKNILFVLPHYNIDRQVSGSTTRTYNIIKNFKDSVKVLQCQGSECENAVNFKPFKLGNKNPSLLLKYSSDYISKLKQVLSSEKFDYLIYEFPWSFKTAYDEASKRGIKAIYEAHNVEHDNVLSSWGERVPRLLLPLVKILVTKHERFACKHSHKIIAMSDKDASRLSELYKVDMGKFIVAPNGVDVARYSKKFSNEEKIKIKEKYGLPIDKKIVVFHGTGKYLANDEAAETIKVLSTHIQSDDYFFVIAGSHMEPYLGDKIRCVGFVEDLPELLGICDAALVPLRHASGTRLKIVEYFAAGVPVVSTAKGVEGLDVKDGSNVLLLDEICDEEILRELDRLGNSNLRKKLISNAKKTAKKYDWKIIAGIIDKGLK